MKKMNVLVLFFLILLLSSKAEAKWWIFGASEGEVMINYLYLNKVSYEEMGSKVTLYKEMLPDGMIVMNGKATVKKAKIGSIRVSINNKESWEEAGFSEGGAFEFRFKPELNKTYTIYIEVMDTRGKTNDIEATRKEIIISEQNIQDIVKDIINKMIDAYKSEDVNRFMSYISEDFAGENLDLAIKKDFSAFNNIDLSYTLNNVATSEKGMIFVSLNYNRSVTSTKSDKTLTDNGNTEFVFKMEDIGPRVFSMNNPLIFGLSDAGNVATGAKPPPTNAINEEAGGGTSTVKSGSITLLSNEGFIFANGAMVSNFSGDINMEFNIIIMQNNTTAKDLGIVSINSITEAPSTGYDPQGFRVDENIGHTFAIKLGNEKYALLEIVDWTDSGRGNFKYKYQTDGTRNF